MESQRADSVIVNPQIHKTHVKKEAKIWSMFVISSINQEDAGFEGSLSVDSLHKEIKNSMTPSLKLSENYLDHGIASIKVGPTQYFAVSGLPMARPGEDPTKSSFGYTIGGEESEAADRKLQEKLLELINQYLSDYKSDSAPQEITTLRRYDKHFSKVKIEKKSELEGDLEKLIKDLVSSEECVEYFKKCLNHEGLESKGYSSDWNAEELQYNVYNKALSAVKIQINRQASKGSFDIAKAVKELLGKAFSIQPSSGHQWPIEIKSNEDIEKKQAEKIKDFILENCKVGDIESIVVMGNDMNNADYAIGSSPLKMAISDIANSLEFVEAGEELLLGDSTTAEHFE